MLYHFLEQRFFLRFFNVIIFIWFANLNQFCLALISTTIFTAFFVFVSIFFLTWMIRADNCVLIWSKCINSMLWINQNNLWHCLPTDVSMYDTLKKNIILFNSVSCVCVCVKCIIYFIILLAIYVSVHKTCAHLSVNLFEATKRKL